MAEKIESFLRAGEKTSDHCATLDAYKSKNTFDIGARSTEKLTKNFSKQKFTNAIKKLEGQGYIKKFLDETGLKNNCWHLEITPHAKDINLYRR